MHLICRLLSCALIASLAAGCGDGRKSAPVSGKVTVNGQPLADIGVNFEPSGAGAGQGSFGKTDAQGRYTLKFVDTDQTGALIGTHQVTFTDLTAVKDQGDGGALPKQQFRFDVRQTSEARQFEVPAGGTTSADFDLK
jgi:hypothetical protein